jgi:hypothetical protein
MKNVKRCVHCLVELRSASKLGEKPPNSSVTLDHVFPKHWFPQSTPQNLNRWTVPACRKCNEELGGIEKVLLNRMVLCLDLTKPELMELYQRVRRGLALNLSEEQRKQISPEELKIREADKQKVFGDIRPWDELSPDEKKSLFPGLGPWQTSQLQLSLTIKHEDIRREVEKMVRGCEWHIAKRLVEPPHSVQVYFVHDKDVPDSIRQILGKFAEKRSIGSYFHVQRAVCHDDPLVVFYRIEFWGHVAVYAYIDKEHSEPSQPVSGVPTPC